MSDDPYCTPYSHPECSGLSLIGELREQNPCFSEYVFAVWQHTASGKLFYSSDDSSERAYSGEGNGPQELFDQDFFSTPDHTSLYELDRWEDFYEAVMDFATESWRTSVPDEQRQALLTLIEKTLAATS